LVLHLEGICCFDEGIGGSLILLLSASKKAEASLGSGESLLGLRIATNRDQ
jgi:hypothetical protein